MIETLAPIVKALREISEWPWWRDNHSDGQYSVWDKKDSRIASPTWNLSNINFIASSPLWLAQMVVALVEERASHYAGMNQRPIQQSYIEMALLDFGLTESDWTWLKGKVGE